MRHFEACKQLVVVTQETPLVVCELKSVSFLPHHHFIFIKKAADDTFVAVAKEALLPEASKHLFGHGRRRWVRFRSPSTRHFD